jgi:hypothetical protein
LEEKIALTFLPAYFYDSPKLARVLVEARIPAANVDFRLKGNQLGTDLKVMGVAYAEDGSVAARFYDTQPVRFSADIKEAREMQKKSFAYRSFFNLHPGKYRIKLAVSDDSNTLGSAERPLEIPELPEKGLAASSLIVAERASKVSETEQQLQAQLSDGSNPLLYGGTQIEPGVAYKVPVNGALPVLFWLYNLTGPSEQWNLSAKAVLVDEKGTSIALDEFLLKNLILPAENGRATALVNILMKNTPAGKYRLKLDVVDAASSQSTSLQTDLEIIK